MKAVVVGVVVALLFASGCGYIRERIISFEILEAFVCEDVDENMNAVGIKNIFDYGTERVCVWIRYRFATKNTYIIVKWFYKDYLVYMHRYIVPANRSSYGYYLMMKGGNPLPKGSYRVEIMYGGKVRTKLSFWIK